MMGQSSVEAQSILMFAALSSVLVQLVPLQGQAASSVPTASKHCAGGKMFTGVKQGRSWRSLIEEPVTMREAKEADSTGSIHAFPASQAASSKWLYSILL